MSKLVLSLTALLAASFMLSACQSDSYSVDGVVEQLQDGDTLFLTKDFVSGTPIDTVIVKDGKFRMEGTTDSTFLCMLYSTKYRGVAIPFFIEPGSVKLRLSDKPEERRISGSSPTNNKWQEMNDSVIRIGRQINMIADYIHGSNLTYEEQQEQMRKHEQLVGQFKSLVLGYARKNVGNEFGYFLLTYYDDMSDMYFPEGLIDARVKLELIGKMPRNMRERATVKALVEQLNKMVALSEGRKIPDFQMNDINGKPLRIMQEVAKNRVTVIDFWASWCGPCVGEMPGMVALYDQYKGKGLGIFGISLDSNQDAWQNATNKFGITWPQVSDLKGWGNEAARMFNVKAIPQTIVVDSTGTILKKGLRGDELKMFVDSTLK